MAIIGGDCTEILCNHPTLGVISFSPKSGETATLDIGGLRNNDDTGEITGNRTNIIIKNVKKWMFEVVCGMDNIVNNDLVNLTALTESNQEGEWTFTFANGDVWGGIGIPVGDIAGDGQAATMTVKVSGGQQMNKIA